MEDLKTSVSEFLSVPGNKEAIAGLVNGAALLSLNPVAMMAVAGTSAYLVWKGELSTK